MKVLNAIKKLERAGFTVTSTSKSFDGNVDIAWVASKPAATRVIEFHRNGRDDVITCIRSRRTEERDEIQSDYFCGRWHDSMTQAINSVEG